MFLGMVSEALRASSTIPMQEHQRFFSEFGSGSYKLVITMAAN
jgi:hypothetical protein